MVQTDNSNARESAYSTFLSILSIDGGIHRTERVLMLDSLEDMVFCYINERDNGCEIYPMSQLNTVFKEYNSYGTEKHRYQYHGGEHGIINGFFSFTDSFVYIYPKGERKAIASVSSYNLAHFFCDRLDSVDECNSFSEWVDGNVFWKDIAVNTVIEKGVNRR